MLLTPCVDYVIVFTGLAGGAQHRLLAAAPLLMLLQIVLLPVSVLLMAGSEAAELIDVAPFVEAFLILIVIPLSVAGIVQALAKKYLVARAIERLRKAVTVPLVMATLAVIIGSQISGIGNGIGQLITVVPVYVAFLVVVTQTLVELVGMILFVRLVPRLTARRR